MIGHHAFSTIAVIAAQALASARHRHVFAANRHVTDHHKIKTEGKRRARGVPRRPARLHRAPAPTRQPARGRRHTGVIPRVRRARRWAEPG
jgi:hypothetical protein